MLVHVNFPCKNIEYLAGCAQTATGRMIRWGRIGKVWFSTLARPCAYTRVQPLVQTRTKHDRNMTQAWHKNAPNMVQTSPKHCPNTDRTWPTCPKHGPNITQTWSKHGPNAAQTRPQNESKHDPNKARTWPKYYLNMVQTWPDCSPNVCQTNPNITKHGPKQTHTRTRARPHTHARTHAHACTHAHARPPREHARARTRACACAHVRSPVPRTRARPCTRPRARRRPHVRAPAHARLIALHLLQVTSICRYLRTLGPRNSYRSPKHTPPDLRNHPIRPHTDPRQTKFRFIFDDKSHVVYCLLFFSELEIRIIH
jgi:hypothetical protein